MNEDGLTEPTEKWRDSLMVVAILIATMAFQAAVTPPGGVWQDNQYNSKDYHIAGKAVMRQFPPKVFKIYIWSNTMAFVFSLSTILLLISGLPFRQKVFTWVLRVIMWLAIASIGTTYTISTYVVTPYPNELAPVLLIALVVWGVVLVILLIGNTLWLFKIPTWLKEINTWQHFRIIQMILGQIPPQPFSTPTTNPLPITRP